MKLERIETFKIMEEVEVKFEQSQRMVKSTERKLKLVEEDLAGYKSEAGELRVRNCEERYVCIRRSLY